MESLGWTFRSRSDTEVVLNALAHWGPDALTRFNGMFALAAWYRDERRLLLARDPMGMKPLYYTVLNGAGVAFASEIKAFGMLKGFKLEINAHSLQQFLEFGYVFDPNDDAAGVFKVPPGHSLTTIVAGQVGQHAYFTAPRSRLPTERPNR
jgi:asparagine synthase (glutamine-hydrolysing)